MLVVQTKIADSLIHGKGLFAAQQIPKGQLIWKFDRRIDRVWPLEAFWWIPLSVRNDILHYGYYNQGTERYVVSNDGSRYINHSSSPNVVTVDANIDGEGVDVAARDIASGEELTMDYWRFDGHCALKLNGFSFSWREPNLPIIAF